MHSSQHASASSLTDYRVIGRFALAVATLVMMVLLLREEGHAQAHDCGTTEKPLRIMPLGDSITESREGYSSYRLTLWKELRAAGCRVNFVGSRRGVSLGYRDSPFATPKDPRFDQDHEGHWAYRVEEVLRQIDTWLQRAKPDVVLLHLGSNDIFRGQSIGSTVAELSRLLDAVRLENPRAVIVVAQLIPAHGRHGIILKLNSKIAALAKRKNSPKSPVASVNMYRGFSVSRDLQADGVHPNNAGDTKIGKRFAKALLKTLPERSF
jgi:acyl-CoA thioesterase-1